MTLKNGTAFESFAFKSQKPNIAALIYAGGRGMRMGGVDKALLPRDGLPMIANLATRLSELCDKIFISRQSDQADLANYGHVLVDFEREQGPLCGLIGAIRAAKNEGYRYLITSPVDCENPPEWLYPMLFQARRPHAVLQTTNALHPTFSLIDLSNCEMIEMAYKSGNRKLSSWIEPNTVASLFVPNFEPQNQNTPNLINPK